MGCTSSKAADGMPISPKRAMVLRQQSLTPAGEDPLQEVAKQITFEDQKPSDAASSSASQPSEAPTPAAPEVIESIPSPQKQLPSSPSPKQQFIVSSPFKAAPAISSPVKSQPSDAASASYRQGLELMKSGSIEEAVELIKGAFENGFDDIRAFLLEPMFLPFYKDERYREVVAVYHTRKNVQQCNKSFEEQNYSEVKSLVESCLLEEQQYTTNAYAHSQLGGVYRMYCISLAVLLQKQLEDRKKAESQDHDEEDSEEEQISRLADIVRTGILFGMNSEEVKAHSSFAPFISHSSIQDAFSVEDLPNLAASREDQAAVWMQRAVTALNEENITEAQRIFNLVRAHYTYDVTPSILQTVAYNSFVCAVKSRDEPSTCLAYLLDSIRQGFRDLDRLQSDPSIVLFREEDPDEYQSAVKDLEEKLLFGRCIEAFESKDMKAAQSLLQQYDEQFENTNDSGEAQYRMACIWSSLGDHSRAMEHLELASQLGWKNYALIKSEEYFSAEQYTSDSNFQLLLRKMEVYILSCASQELYDLGYYEDVIRINVDEIAGDELLSSNEAGSVLIQAAHFNACLCFAHLDKKDKVLEHLNKLADSGFQEGAMLADEAAFDKYQDDADIKHVLHERFIFSPEEKEEDGEVEA